jgi:hypothetical protein
MNKLTKVLANLSDSLFGFPVEIRHSVRPSFGIVTCPGFRDKKFMGSGLDEAVLLDNSFTITITITLT